MVTQKKTPQKTPSPARTQHISPSLLAAHPLAMEQTLLELQESGADRFHIDVMDGYFVPNMAFSPDLVRSLGTKTSLPLDVHLMVLHPDVIVPYFLKTPATSITCHTEAFGANDTQGRSVLAQIKKADKEAGLALKPATPITDLFPYKTCFSHVVLMSVEPGFGGQSFLESQIEKLKNLVLWRQKEGLSFQIHIDGGVTDAFSGKLWGAGANVLVAGTYLLGPGAPYHQAIQALRPLRL